jgi:hypothetical protein
MRGRGRVVGSQPMSIAVHKRPNKLWRSNSIFTLRSLLCNRNHTDSNVPLIKQCVKHRPIAFTDPVIMWTGMPVKELTISVDIADWGEGGYPKKWRDQIPHTNEATLSDSSIRLLDGIAQHEHGELASNTESKEGRAFLFSSELAIPLPSHFPPQACAYRFVFAVRRQSGGQGKNFSCASCRLYKAKS